jgi:hypothetical protein
MGSSCRTFHEESSEHVVGSEGFGVAVAAYFAACQRWPKAKIILQQGAWVVKRNWR